MEPLTRRPSVPLERGLKPSSMSPRRMRMQIKKIAPVIGMAEHGGLGARPGPPVLVMPKRDNRSTTPCTAQGCTWARPSLPKHSRTDEDGSQVPTPLNASASSAGALFSNSAFDVPQFQREYSWGEDEVTDFWNDLSSNLESDAYFIGLIILTEEKDRKHVVDGQQRLITLTLLATAIYFEAKRRGRGALADRIQADFLRSIDYESDNTDPRVRLSDPADDQTLQSILDTGDVADLEDDGESVSARMVASYKYLARKLSADLAADPFKRLGRWTDFLTNRLYFAVFVHPEPSLAYQVYEVINTRGKELTTADLLKNYILSQTAPAAREARYWTWQEISKQFSAEGSNNFVQYIRHAVTVSAGHVLPKDLFIYLAQRVINPAKPAPTPDQLMELLERRLPLYSQMIDPSLAGPAEGMALGVFSALNSLGVIAVRPLLLAISDTQDADAGMRYVLELVVRRIVVGNLGTGNVERRLGEAAKKIHDTGDWRSVVDDLKDLNPDRDEFVAQVKRRSFNKGVLAFLRRSVIQNTITPDQSGYLHFIWTKQAEDWDSMTLEDGGYWYATIGNTFLSSLDRRPRDTNTWESFKENLLPTAIAGEWQGRLGAVDEWDAAAVENLGDELAEAAGHVWY
jgi:hypothetical protein